MLDWDSSPPGTYAQVSASRYGAREAPRRLWTSYTMTKSGLKSLRGPGVAFGGRPMVPASAAASGALRRQVDRSRGYGRA